MYADATLVPFLHIARLTDRPRARDDA